MRDVSIKYDKVSLLTQQAWGLSLHLIPSY